MAPSIVIESREHLIGWLGEAAEIEHNLMCCYLYAMFGLKRSIEEGLNEEELAAVERWRKVMLGVALEEMNHLTLVGNLTTAVGGSPHFGRPNFPTDPGPYPADLVMELAPFNLDTLDHFIYVERPENQAYPDGATFDRGYTYVREPLSGRLMPSAGTYPTVGSLYQSIRRSIAALVERIGEKRLFCGCPTIQIGPLESQLPGLNVIRDQASANLALDTIVTQGEGAAVEEGSHFARFLQIRREYEELIKKNPAFVPGRPVARNPVMRSPIKSAGRVWVTEPLASGYIDMANAIYTLMLRVLVQIYSITGRSRESKRALLDTSYALMHSLVPIAETLTRMNANKDLPGVNAGMSFAMLRSLAPLEAYSEKAVLTERMNEVLSGFKVLQDEVGSFGRDHPELASCLAQLQRAAEPIERARDALLKVEWKPPLHGEA
ncbi:MAG TPA: ferritin-like protein, partial [bacterium]|nr:ferritin-like protein [bacterium]